MTVSYLAAGLAGILYLIVLKRAIFGPLSKFSMLAIFCLGLGLVIADISNTGNNLKVSGSGIAIALVIISIVIVQLTIILEYKYLRNNKPS